MFVSRVYPVLVLTDLFCVVCSFSMLVFEVMMDQIVSAYSMMVRVMVLYVVVSVFFDLPQSIVLSACVTCLLFMLRVLKYFACGLSM